MRVSGGIIQPELVERLVADGYGQAGILPLLEFALTEIWNRDHESGALRLDTYEALGHTLSDGTVFSGLRGAIARRAEALWAQVEDEERGREDFGTGRQRAIRNVFLKLLFPEGISGTGTTLSVFVSRRARKGEFRNEELDILERLVQARLLSTGLDSVTGAATVEVAHEALISAWPRLQTWAVEHTSFIDWYTRRLLPMILLWEKEGSPDDLLIPDTALDECQRWVQTHGELIPDFIESYVEASVVRQSKRNEERRLLEAHARVREQNEELERRVQERTSELVSVNHELEAFAYSISHDLRAPLRAIVSTSRLLLEDLQDLVPEDSTRLLERQVWSINRMARLIDDLLQWSRIGRRAISRESVDLSSLAEDVLAEILDRKRNECKWEIEIEKSMVCICDGPLTRHLLQQLLSNAVKFSPQGGRIVFERSGKDFLLQDSGIGFDKREALRVVAVRRIRPVVRVKHVTALLIVTVRGDRE